MRTEWRMRSHASRGTAGRAGVTLVELLVALVIMSILAGLATLTFRRVPSTSRTPAWQDSLAIARRGALATARPVTTRAYVGERIVLLTVMPDGGVVADPEFGLESLTGEVPVAQE